MRLKTTRTAYVDTWVRYEQLRLKLLKMRKCKRLNSPALVAAFYLYTLLAETHAQLSSQSRKRARR